MWNFLLVTFAIFLSVTAQRQERRLVSSDEVFHAYSPGQYPLGEQGVKVSSATPRLVATKDGQLVQLSNGGRLKRVRVVPANQLQHHQSTHPQPQTLVQSAHQGLYTVEAPLTYSQTAAIGRQYQPQAIQYIQQAQPTYYLQRAPVQPVQPQYAPAPKPQTTTTIFGAPSSNKPKPQGILIPKGQAKDEDDEYPSDPNPQYNFSFDVKDDELTNYQNRQEERDNGVIKGSYSVVDPDGYVRTVTYTADSKNGFQAKVVREPTDVKVKFPVPTKAPEEEQLTYKKPVYRQLFPQQQQYAQPQQYYRQQQ